MNNTWGAKVCCCYSSDCEIDEKPSVFSTLFYANTFIVDFVIELMA